MKPGVTLPESAETVLREVRSATFVGSGEEFFALAVPPRETDAKGNFLVGYEVLGRGFVPEMRVCRVRNGLSGNYLEP